mmetsp:Transcript_21565/g.41897  ORF Transcript_21565/g.41897 Transcript_21565/m.41897 type:complete len:233 (-) Transcript_21565:304-1002(-)
MLSLLQGVPNKLFYLLINVVVVPRRVILHLGARPIERHRSTVTEAALASIQLSCKYFGTLPETLRTSPDPLQTAVLVAFVSILVVHPTPEEASHACLCTQKPRLSVGVPEGIDLPRALWVCSRTKGVHQELMSTCRLIHHFDVVWRRLIVHAPTPVDKLKLSPLNHSASHVLDALWLLIPPSFEEPCFDIHETSVGVFMETADNIVEDVVHVCEEILIHGYLPSGIIVRMGY